MPDFTVNNYGVDSSGRAILMTAYMHEWWESVVDDLGFRPVITQGAWMARVPGGGADNSEGFHDGGGCLDLRVWDRSPSERVQMVRKTRLHAAGGWRRYKSQGMSEDHFHLVLGTDHGLTAGAADQWQDYVKGRDGLAGDDPDYEWRPSPLVLTPPEDTVDQEQEDRVVERSAKRAAELVLAAKVGKDDTTLKQAINKILTKVERL